MNSTKSATEHLISLVTCMISEPYSEWRIGVSSKENVDSENSSMTMFNVRNNEATLSALNHFVAIGVQPKKPIGKRAKFLYLYKLGDTSTPKDMY